MKHNRFQGWLVGICLWFVADNQIGAQSYAVHWFTVDGGGGVSSGDGYSLRGTIGQADAGAMSGGGFSLTGGFWSGAGETMPTLRIQRAGNDVIVSWPNPSTGFDLQENAGLMGAWNSVGQAPSVVGAEKQVTVPAGPGSRFYRLRKP